MSKRFAWTAMLLALLATNANADSPNDVYVLDTEARVVLIGDSGWELFRPVSREQNLFDLAFLTNHLRSEHAGLGLRFHSSPHLTLGVEIDPFTQRRNLIGPIYDFGIGATRLALHFNF